jgi:hypothetical protein
MTQNIFNLYAANVFAEHPKGLWALDEDFSFLSLVSGSPNWFVTNGETTTVVNLPATKPEETVGIADISLNLDSFIGYGNNSEIRTQSFSTPDDIDSEKPTVCISSFIYPYDTDISELEIGFEYESPLFVSNAGVSTNGITWTQTTQSLGQTKIIYGKNTFVGILFNSAVAQTLTDGVRWTTTTMPSSQKWRSGAYGNNIFVAAIEEFGGFPPPPPPPAPAASSTDGITWTARTMPSSQRWRSVAYGNNTFVAVSYYTYVGSFPARIGAAATSTDGITWTPRTLPAHPNSAWTVVGYGNNIFVAAARNSNLAAASTDGISWTVTVLATNFSEYSSIAYGSGTFVLVSYRRFDTLLGEFVDPLINISTDGITWVARTWPLIKRWYGVAYGNGFFVVTADDSNNVLVSTDAVTWTISTSLGSSQILEFGLIKNNVTNKYKNLKLNSWEKIEHTINLPNINTPITPYINVKHYGSEKTYSLYQFAVGQWSESFNHKSTGTVPIPLEQISASSSLQYAIGNTFINHPEKITTLVTDNYGFAKGDDGYYIIEDNKMLAINSTLPMVFGSGDITEIKASPSGGPSIVFPGKGFFHQDGKFQNITAEFWLKINPQTSQSRKIFGPVSSNDGLYVEDKYLTLKIGPYEKSYFIHKWYRPMLIDIRYSPLSVTVLINGDQVIEQGIVLRDIEFPNSLFENNDWVGFYGYEDIPQFEVDCLAIYPYDVLEQAAKRKFVYGQGVYSSDEVTQKFGGSSITIDFPFAEYTKNIIYPDMTRWNAGFYSNVSANSKFIGLPEYSPPEFSYVGDDLTPFNLNRSRRTWNGIKTTNLWETLLASTWRRISQSRELDPEYDNYFLQSEGSEKIFIKLKPTSGYENLYGSLIFDSINVLSERVNSILGVFSINSSEVNETEENQITIMHFKNNATGNRIDIVLNKTTQKIQYLYNFDIIKEQDLTLTLSDKEFIVGIKIDDFSKSYAAIIRNFFATPQNIKMSVGGVDRNTFPGKIYRVVFNNSFFTRKDMLSYYSSDGVTIYNNLTINQSIFTYIGNYTLKLSKTNNSIVLDVATAGYWEDSIPFSSFASLVENAKGQRNIYDVDMLQFNIDYPSPLTLQGDFDKDDNVKAYVSIQRFEDVGGVSYLNYSTIKNLEGKRYIDFDKVLTNIDNTKFRIVDNTVIFPPKKIISFDKAYMTIHLEMKVDGINAKRTEIQRMSLASLAFDESKLYALSSQTGNKIYPFTRQGKTYSTKTKNPFLIQKETAPYLYLTGDSGIQAIPYPEVESLSSSNFARGLSIPINASKKQNFILYGMHAWVFYNSSEQFNQKEIMFSLSYLDKRYNFYLEPEIENKRAKIVAYEKINSFEIITDEFNIFENGIKKQVYLYPQSWSLITIKLKNPQNLGGIIGQFEINPGILVKNFTSYESSIEKRVDDIFESHLGLSNIVAQDNTTLSINSDSLNIFSGVRWTTFIGKTV